MIQTEGIVLQVEHLRCAYHAGQPVLSMQELDVRRGEVLFILGRSGVGKSTLLELVALMNRPAGTLEGQVKFTDKSGRVSDILELWHSSFHEISGFRRHHYSFIFQEPNFLNHYSSGENMLLPALVQGRMYADAEQEVLSLMGDLDLDPSLRDQVPSRLSGGQRQRMAFIRALVSDFDILFGDEPTGNLDPVSASRLISLLRARISGTERAAVVVSHDLSLARRYADRIALITRGGPNDPSGHLHPGHIAMRVKDGWHFSGQTIRDEDLEARLHHLLEHEETAHDTNL